MIWTKNKKMYIFNKTPNFLINEFIFILKETHFLKSIIFWSKNLLWSWKHVSI